MYISNISFNNISIELNNRQLKKGVIDTPIHACKKSTTVHEVLKS